MPRHRAPISSRLQMSCLNRSALGPELPTSQSDCRYQSIWINTAHQPTCFAYRFDIAIPSCFQTMKNLILSHPHATPSLNNPLEILSSRATKCRNSCRWLGHQADHAVPRESVYPPVSEAVSEAVSEGLILIDNGAQRC